MIIILKGFVFFLYVAVTVIPYCFLTLLYAMGGGDISKCMDKWLWFIKD
jgi:hypothetical protein